MSEKLFHESVDFGPDGGRGSAYVIVDDDKETTLYLGIHSTSRGIGVQLTGLLSIEDTENLIALLQRGLDVVKENVARAAKAKATAVPAPCPNCGPRGRSNVQTAPDAAGYEFLTTCDNCYDAEITEDGPRSSSLMGHGRTREESIADWNERVEETDPTT